MAEPDAVNGCILKSDDDDDDDNDVVKSPLLGYLAGTPGTSGRGRRRRGQACGTEQSPWLVVAGRGQRIRFTLMDFSSSTDALDDNLIEEEAAQSQIMSQDNNGLFSSTFICNEIYYIERIGLA